MKKTLKLIFLSNIFMIAAAGDAFARRGARIQRRPALPIYWADVIIDTVGAFLESLFKTIIVHPFMTVVIILLIASFFKIHDIYENSMYAFRQGVTGKDEPKSVFISDEEKPKRPLSLPLARSIYVGSIILLVTCCLLFFLPFKRNLSYEMHIKKMKRDRIDYKAKTVEDAYKNAR